MNPKPPGKTGRAGRRPLAAVLLGASWSALGLGCASGPAVNVVDARELASAGGAPELEEVQDLGGWDIPAVGRVRSRPSDGVAVIGESLWIRGDDFGRLPTVLVGGRPAAVVSRSADGGILVRVPPGTPVGEQLLEVSHREGEDGLPLLLRRIGGVAGGGQITWFGSDGTDTRILGSAALPGAGGLAFSADGRAAYVLGRDGIHVFEVPAPRVPFEVGKLEAPGPVRAVLAASAASTLVVVSERAVTRYDTRWPLRPVAGPRIALPKGLVVAAGTPLCLSADGTLLALAPSGPNRVQVLALQAPGQRGRVVSAAERASGPAAPASAAIEPEVRAPVINGLAFSPGGETLWAVSGANAQNRSLGPRPTRVHVLRVERAGAGVAVSPHRSFEVAGADAPTAIAIPHAGLPSGSAIRFPPEAATVHVSAVATRLDKPAVFSVAPGQAPTPVLVASGAVLGGSATSPDGGTLFAAVLDRQGRGLLVVGSPGQVDAFPKVLPLPGAFGARVSGGEVRVAPIVGLQP